ncbi:MAG: hypothetical protein A2Y17_07335 [Clostridiales bacterium GWF2_38_85]|nr:MAG: hypothetical protein A2Y17_07335 [Clostridiales bacterium GWF2_38_85]HBL84316.1 hypothetical protein [Clostridiales bacterium]
MFIFGNGELKYKNNDYYENFDYHGHQYDYRIKQFIQLDSYSIYFVQENTQKAITTFQGELE